MDNNLAEETTKSKADDDKEDDDKEEEDDKEFDLNDEMEDSKDVQRDYQMSP
jgi:hypothetical protein